MDIKRIFSIREQPVYADIALLVLRVVVGYAFFVHGHFKMQHPFSWMGPYGTTPPFFQGLATLSEFGGGMAWIAGLLTPLAAFGILCTMAVAFTSMSHFPFVANSMGPTSELPAAYFCVALVILLMGPGRFSIDRLIFGQRTPNR